MNDLLALLNEKSSAKEDVFLPAQNKFCICNFANVPLEIFILGVLISEGAPQRQMYIYPAGTYLFKVNNRNTRSNCEICSKLTVKTTKQRHWRRSGVFIVNFEHISHLVLVFLLLTFNRKLSAVKELVQHICSSFLAVSCFSKKAPSKGPTYAC